MKLLILLILIINSAFAQLPKPGGGGDDFSVQRMMDGRITGSVNERTSHCGMKNVKPRHILDVYHIIMSAQIIENMGKPISGKVHSPMCESLTTSESVSCLLTNSKEDLRAFVGGNCTGYLQAAYEVSEEDAINIHNHLKAIVEKLERE